jgi:hypothetical protein
METVTVVTMKEVTAAMTIAMVKKVPAMIVGTVTAATTVEVAARAARTTSKETTDYIKQ